MRPKSITSAAAERPDATALDNDAVRAEKRSAAEATLVVESVGPFRRLGRSRLVLLSLVAVIAVALWHSAVTVFGVPTYLLPEPLAVARAFARYRSELWTGFRVTLFEVVVGFGLAIVIGASLSLLIVYSKILERILFPVLVASQSVPKVAIAPLLLVWFGFGITSKIVIAALIAFFPIVINTTVGLRSVHGDLIDLARSMGASAIKVFMNIRLPSALPSIMGGLKIAVTLSVIGAIVGEFVGGDAGLGYLIQISIGYQRLDLMFSALAVLSALGIGLFYFVDLAERLLLPWHHNSDVEAKFEMS